MISHDEKDIWAPYMIKALHRDLATLKEAGFNVIGYTIMLCEFTFIFNTDEEARAAHAQFENIPGKSIIQGWWYGKEEFEKAKITYEKDFRDDNNPLFVKWIG